MMISVCIHCLIKELNYYAEEGINSWSCESQPHLNHTATMWSKHFNGNTTQKFTYLRRLPVAGWAYSEFVSLSQKLIEEATIEKVCVCVKSKNKQKQIQKIKACFS